MSDSQTSQPVTPLSTPPSSEPWRAPATAQSWAAGKTAEEILGIAGPAMEMLEKFNLSGRVLTNNQPAQGYQPQQAQPIGYPAQQFQNTAAPAQPDPNDYPNWGQLNAWGQQQVQQQFAPSFNQLYENQAAQSLQMLRSDTKNQKVFERYGPEVNTMIAQVPPAARTLDNLQLLVDVVRGRHVDEFARDRAAELAATTPPTMRPNGFAGAGGPTSTDNGLTLQSEKIPSAWRERAQQQGLTDEGIAEFCRANNQTPAQFYGMLMKHNDKVVTDTRVINTDGKQIGREITLG